MKAFILLSLIGIIVTTAVTAQNIHTSIIVNKSIRRNAFYFEFLGNGAYYSLNYDRASPLKK